jgi:MinD superfamily P-loop ATPase
VEHVDPAILNRFDTRSSRLCEFCREQDPQFAGRRPLDQMVAMSRSAVASAHLTEDGYVRHRMLEIRQKVERLAVTAA